MNPIETRVGTILLDDNRFFGRSAFHEWMRDARSPTDLVAAALGIDVDNNAREVLRVLSVAVTSPDARVWPLKLTRLLACYGDAAMAFFTAQLVSSGRIMGPGTVAGAAAMLARWTTDDDDTRTAFIAAAKTQSKVRLPGFGVPFRQHDERLVGLTAVIDKSPAQHGRHWRAMGILRRDVATFSDVSPNVSLGVAALLLDLGVAPDMCGLALSMLMSHVFLAHAIEASTTDAALQTLPTTTVHYAGPPARSSSSRHSA